MQAFPLFVDQAMDKFGTNYLSVCIKYLGEDTSQRITLKTPLYSPDGR